MLCFCVPFQCNLVSTNSIFFPDFFFFCSSLYVLWRWKLSAKVNRVPGFVHPRDVIRLNVMYTVCKCFWCTPGFVKYFFFTDWIWKYLAIFSIFCFIFFYLFTCVLISSHHQHIVEGDLGWSFFNLDENETTNTMTDDETVIVSFLLWLFFSIFLYLYFSIYIFLFCWLHRRHVSPGPNYFIIKSFIFMIIRMKCEYFIAQQWLYR